jgi:hypothetical protein
MLSFSLNSPFLISHSDFSNVYTKEDEFIVKCKKNLVNGQVNNELMYFVLYNTCNMIEYLSARKQHILITRHK